MRFVLIPFLIAAICFVALMILAPKPVDLMQSEAIRMPSALPAENKRYRCIYYMDGEDCSSNMLPSEDR